MEIESTGNRSRNRQRWTLLLVVLVGSLAAGAMTVPRLRSRGSRQVAPGRLDLLYEAWNEFNAARFDRATEILDRRAAAGAPTALDWMLRASIADSLGWARERSIFSGTFLTRSDQPAGMAKVGQIGRAGTVREPLKQRISTR